MLPEGQSERAMVTLVDMETEGLVFRAIAQVDESGDYRFDDVPFGTYEVSAIGPDGYLSPEPVQLGISEKANESIDFTLNVITDQVHIPFYSH